MNFFKAQKGDFDYPVKQKKNAIIRTVIYFTLPLMIFIMGYLSTKTKSNLLTVVAIVGLLPGCKSLINVIMFFLIPKFDENIFNNISPKSGNVSILYSLFLTTEKKNYPVNCFAVKGNSIIGYTEFKDFNTSDCVNHIDTILKQNSIKNVNITFFDNINKFENRLEQMQKIEAGNNDAEVVSLLCDISL